MIPFTSPISSADLQKSADNISLSRNLPADPSDVANRINGVRDDSLKNAQTALIGVGLTQQSLEGLPEPIKTQDSVKKMSTDLSSAETDITTQMVEVQTLHNELTNIEGKQEILLSEKSRIEVSVIAAAPSLSPEEYQAKLEGLPEYQKIQKDLDHLNQQHAEVLAQYNVARNKLNNISGDFNGRLDTYSSQLSTLKQQALSLQDMPGSVLTQVPQTPEIPTDALAIMSMSLGILASIPAFQNLMSSGKSKIPKIPNVPNMPEVPSIEDIPKFDPPFEIDGIEYQVVPPGLFDTPPMPAFPAFPGTPEMPEIPPTDLDESMASLLDSNDTDVMGEAAAASNNVDLEDVKKQLPESLVSEASPSALEKTAKGHITKAMSKVPAVPDRPALPDLPGTTDLTSWAGKKVPTLKSLEEHADVFSPEEKAQYAAFWTDVQGKYAASQRATDALRERTAMAQSAMQQLVDAQKLATQSRIPLAQQILKTTGTSGIYNALAVGSITSVFAKYAKLPETPQFCTEPCFLEDKRVLFPDLSNPLEVKGAEFFADAQTLVSDAKSSVVSVGSSQAGFVTAHVANLESRVKAAGGKVTSLQTDDLRAALENSADMVSLEDKLRGTSLVTFKDIKNLSPQESGLLSDITAKMSGDVPVVMTTPSIGTLSDDPAINSALIAKHAPAGSAVDVRAPKEVPTTSVYDDINKPDLDEESTFSSFFASAKNG